MPAGRKQPVPKLQLLTMLVVQAVVVENALLGSVFPTCDKVVPMFDGARLLDGYFPALHWHDGLSVMTETPAAKGPLNRNANERKDMHPLLRSPCWISTCIRGPTGQSVSYSS